MAHHDALYERYRNVDALLQGGEITWGVVFMANTAVWEPGDEDQPLGVVYSFDPWFEQRPERLRPLGKRLFAFHASDDEPPRRPWEREVRDQLYTGLERPLHDELPPSLSGGRVAFHSSAIACRAHMPEGFLADTLLPLLVHRTGRPPTCMPVPHHYWPRELLTRWSS